jgi:hypothetical protein
MLYWPLRSPFSASRRLPGNAARSFECRGRFQTVKLQEGGPLNAGKGFDPFAGSKVEGACPDSLGKGKALEGVSWVGGVAAFESEDNGVGLEGWVAVDALPTAKADGIRR